jgi:hypothetical protein
MNETRMLRIRFLFPAFQKQETYHTVSSFLRTLLISDKNYLPFYIYIYKRKSGWPVLCSNSLSWLPAATISHPSAFPSDIFCSSSQSASTPHIQYSIVSQTFPFMTLYLKIFPPDDSHSLTVN